MPTSPTESSNDPARDLARSLVDRLLAADPFTATALGLREYDALVPDPSRAAEDELATDLIGFAEQADALLAAGKADTAGTVTLEVVRATCRNRVAALGLRPAEHTVTPMPLGGPPSLMAVLARSVLPDPAAAADYLERVRKSADWVDGTTARLAEGAARGRYPVGSLLEDTVGWVDRTLAQPVPAAVLAPQPPEGWDGVSAWRDELEQVARDGLVPALARWRERLTGLRAHARPDDRAGLAALPGGDDDYARAIAFHTTLPLSTAELHRVGREHLASL